MTRTTPDPLFAAAARAEVQRRVRASAGVERPRRPWVMELAAIAGVAAVVAGVAFGITTLRPGLDAGGAPIGSTTETAAPTPGPAPLRTGPAKVVPTTVPPIPTSPPTASAPTTTHASSAALIGPTGAKVRTSAEIRAWGRARGIDSVSTEQAVIMTSCMAGLGFRYDPEYVADAGLAAQHVGLTDAQYAAFRVAEYGPDTNLPYDWTTAGCNGVAVHRTGMDGKD